MFKFTSLEEDFGRKTEAKNALKSFAFLCGLVAVELLYVLAGGEFLLRNAEDMLVVGPEKRR
jgi:hypothetical protein